MKDKIIREVRVEEDKVFAVTRAEKINNDNRLTIKTLEEEMSLESIEAYLEEDKEQMERYSKQELENIEKIKEIELRLSELSEDQGYKNYKVNFKKYDLFEKLIELKLNPDILNEELKSDLKEYQELRDTKEYKNYYVTYTDEQGLNSLYENIEAYSDIKEERQLFLTQIEECRELLQKND